MSRHRNSAKKFWLPAGTTTEVSSPWSPDFNLYITTPVVTRIDGIPLIGVEGGMSQSAQAVIGNTAGEWVVSKSASSRRQASFGYQGQIINLSVWWAMYLGPQGPGGTEATPPDKLKIADFVNLEGRTPQEVNTIALGLRHHGYVQLRDANGNQQLGGNRWIKFDYENRPVRVINADGATTDFVYDYEGNRVQKTTRNSELGTRNSVYIGQIYEITGGQTIQYITAGSLRVAMLAQSGGGGPISNSDLLYYLPDHLGGTHVMTDRGQNRVRTTQYTPFGSTYLSTQHSGLSAVTDSDYKFTGQRLDDSTGLYYYNARYYDPLQARFITPDTLIQNPYDPQTLNRYTYCRNNPIIYTDPSGQIFWAPILIGAAIGAAVGGTHGNLFSAQAWQNFDWKGALIGAAAGAALGWAGQSEVLFPGGWNFAGQEFAGSILAAGGAAACSQMANCHADTTGYDPAGAARASYVNSRPMNPIYLGPTPPVQVNPSAEGLLASGGEDGRIPGYADAVNGWAKSLDDASEHLNVATAATLLLLFVPGGAVIPGGLGLGAGFSGLGAGTLYLAHDAMTGEIFQKTNESAIRTFRGVAVGVAFQKFFPADLRDVGRYGYRYVSAGGRFISTAAGRAITAAGATLGIFYDDITKDSSKR